MAVGSAVAVVAVGAAVGTGLALEQLTTLPNMSMIFLLAVLICAFRFGVSAAVSASVLSFMAYNFFFIEPRHTFTIARPHELFAPVIFLAVAVVTGGLAGRLRDQANATRARAEATQSLSISRANCRVRQKSTMSYGLWQASPPRLRGGVPSCC